MISQTAEYALRAAVFLASAENSARTTREISEATKIPPSYLAKVLGALARARIVHSQRGPRGGFCLARRAAPLSVFEVVQAVDDWHELDGCPLGLPEHSMGRLCPLHRHLADAQRHMESAFRGCPVATLLDGRPPVAAIDRNVPPVRGGRSSARRRRASSERRHDSP